MFSRSRVIGFALLLGGFLWLCWDSFSFLVPPPPLLRPYKLGPPIDPAASFSYRDLLHTIGELDSRFLFLFPGCIILAGGLLLAFAFRRKVSSDSDANI